MIVDWPQGFDEWLDHLEVRADQGDRRASRRLALVTAELQVLTRLPEKPAVETATLRRVRQRRRHEIWRLSHPYEAGVAMRVICWFSDEDAVVVVAFAADKAKAGDVFYDQIGTKADAIIDQYRRESRRS